MALQYWETDTFTRFCKRIERATPGESVALMLSFSTIIEQCPDEKLKSNLRELYPFTLQDIRDNDIPIQFAFQFIIMTVEDYLDEIESPEAA